MVATAAATCGLVLDQASKAWILHVVMDPPRVIPVTPFFNLTLGFNRGVSFGLFAADSPWTPWLLSGFAILVLVGLAVWLAREPRHGLAFGLIAGGALGNVVDRVRQGAVTDFLDIHGWGYHWPAFNIADTLIFLGAALLLLADARGPRAASRPEAAPPLADAAPTALAGHPGVAGIDHERKQG